MLNRVGACISDARPFTVNWTRYRRVRGTCRSQRTSCTGSHSALPSGSSASLDVRPVPFRNGCRGRVHSANLEKLCQVLEVLRVGLQRETGPVPHEDATQHRPLTSITRPDARHDPCLEAINDRLVDLVQCGGLAFRTEVVAAETAQGVAPHVVGQARHGFDRDPIVFGEHTVDLGLKRLRHLTHAI